MATYKRRVIYMSDEEWTGLDQEAHDRRTTISAVIRHAVWERDNETGQAWARANKPTQLAERAVDWDRHPNVLTQIERDAILRRVNRSKR